MKTGQPAAGAASQARNGAPRLVTLPTVLIRLREKAHLSQQQLADAAQLDISAIREMESSARLTPQSETCEKIAKALRVDASVIFPRLCEVVDYFARQKRQSLPQTDDATEGRWINYHITRKQFPGEPRPRTIWMRHELQFASLGGDMYSVAEPNSNSKYTHDGHARLRESQLYLYAENPANPKDDYAAFYDSIVDPSDLWTGIWFGRDWQMMRIVAPALLSRTELSMARLSSNASLTATELKERLRRNLVSAPHPDEAAMFYLEGDAFREWRHLPSDDA